MKNLSPKVTLSKLSTKKGNRFAVRDDLLPGGTKQRACAPFLTRMQEFGFDHFVYASPFSGFAQVALAYVCRELKIPCTLFAERDQRFPEKQVMHPFTELALSYGATVHIVDSLDEAENDSVHFAWKTPLCFKIPLGFACESFNSALDRELQIQWDFMHDMLGPVKTIWLPLGSGTLAQSFGRVLPADVTINCVNVHVLSRDDRRIQNITTNPRFNLFHASVPFREEAQHRPSIPSNLFYDAKVWSFLEEYGHEGDVWWNVAQ